MEDSMEPAPRGEGKILEGEDEAEEDEKETFLKVRDSGTIHLPDVSTCHQANPVATASSSIGHCDALPLDVRQANVIFDGSVSQITVGQNAQGQGLTGCSPASKDVSCQGVTVCCATD